MKQVDTKQESAIWQDTDSLTSSLLSDQLVSAIQRVEQMGQKKPFEHPQPKKKRGLIPLPDLTTSHQTTLPSGEHFRGLAQSFGSRVARSLWNTESSREQLLEAPNRAQLAVRGENGHEQKTLHQFVDGGMGVEGIKYMVVLLAAYYVQTGAIDRKMDACITLRQLLQFIGRGNHADDVDEQHKLMHYILYLSRTWITALDKLPEQEKRKGRPRRGYLQYTPLIVLEALRSDEYGHIQIPDAIEFHLGKEFWDQMFGQHKHFFTLPTRLILHYSSRYQPQEICLAFYLSNMINLNGTFSVHFPVLLTQTGLVDQQDIDDSAHRTRNASRAVYALEQLEIDQLLLREPHADIDTALAVDYFTGEIKKSSFAQATEERIINAYRHFQALPLSALKAKKRQALQSLLETVTHNTIKFKPGPLINGQIQKREQGRQEARERREQAQQAAQKKARAKKIDAA